MIASKRVVDRRKVAIAPSGTRSHRVVQPQPIVCAGLFSSGSTWAFNVVAELLARTRKKDRANGRTVVQFYADRLEAFPDDAEGADVLVIKTHSPDKPLQVYRCLTHAPTILAVREPRDAVASLMRRFEFAFHDACRNVAKSATHLLALSQTGSPFMLRFEERFYDDNKTITALAAFLGLRPSPTVVRSIAWSLTRESVKRTIADLHRTGVFGVGPPPDQFDPRTHWHPGHVGDAVVGGHAEVLSIEQQIEVLTATGAYCGAFGYSVDMLAVQHDRVPARA
jgi:hypothetical protein